MSHDEDKLIRQLSLIAFLLSRPRPFSAREIQESVEGYYDMSDETFTRRFYGDRADLQRIGIEVRALASAESADVQMYCLTEEDYRLPSLDFTPAERHSLALTLAALDGRFAYARPLRLALTAITGGQPDPLHDELEQLPVALAPDEDARRAGKQLSRLEQAVTRGKTVSFAYPSTDGGTEQRTFDPYNLFLIQGRWYAVGFDHARQAIRTFRVARIVGLVRFLTEKTRDFRIPSDYDSDVYRARPPWLIGPVRGTACIKVEEELSWWASRLAPHVQPLGEDTDGCTLFEAPYADDEVLLSWVVGLGSCGELLAPAELRESLHRRLLDVLSDHQGPSANQETGTGPLEPPTEASSRARVPEPTPDCGGPIAPEHLARALVLLHYLLAENRPGLITWQALHNDVGLSREEVEADLSLLNLVNFGGGTYALAAETGDAGVTVTRDVMADTFAHPARLSPLMARALLLAMDLLGDVIDSAGTESLASMRAKIVGVVSESAADPPVVVDDLMPPSHTVMSVLSDGIRHRRIVEIEYFTPTRGHLAQRRIEPYLLFRSRDGWYVEAYCLLAGGQRTFKVEFIRTARATDEVFVRRVGVDLSHRLAGAAFSDDSAVSWASIRFSPRWRSYLEDRGIDYETQEDGRLAARVPYLDERWMAREVVRLLGGAMLDQPASLRARIHDLAAELLGRYSGGENAGGGLSGSHENTGTSLTSNQERRS